MGYAGFPRVSGRWVFEDHVVWDVSIFFDSRVIRRGYFHDPRGKGRFSPFLFSTHRGLGRGRTKMLPKPTEKTSGAVSERSE